MAGFDWTDPLGLRTDLGNLIWQLQNPEQVAYDQTGAVPAVIPVGFIMAGTGNGANDRTDRLYQYDGGDINSDSSWHDVGAVADGMPSENPLQRAASAVGGASSGLGTAVDARLNQVTDAKAAAAAGAAGTILIVGVLGVGVLIASRR